MNDKTNLHQALENLLQIVSPKQLKANITHVFFGYLMQVDDAPPNNFKEIVEDVYMLLECLEEISDEYK